MKWIDELTIDELWSYSEGGCEAISYEPIVLECPNCFSSYEEINTL